MALVNYGLSLIINKAGGAIYGLLVSILGIIAFLYLKNGKRLGLWLGLIWAIIQTPMMPSFNLDMSQGVSFYIGIGFLQLNIVGIILATSFIKLLSSKKV